MPSEIQNESMNSSETMRNPRVDSLAAGVTQRNLTSVQPGSNAIPSPPTLARERGSAARDRRRQRRVSSHRGGEWAWVVVAIAMLGVVIVVSMSISLVLRVSQTEQEVIPTAVAVLPTPVDARADFTSLAGSQQIVLNDGRSFVLTPWNGTSRFTVLVMGLDRRPGENGPSLPHRHDDANQYRSSQPEHRHPEYSA